MMQKLFIHYIMIFRINSIKLNFYTAHVFCKVTKCVLYALSKSPQKVRTLRTYRQKVRSQKIHSKIQMLSKKI